VTRRACDGAGLIAAFRAAVEHLDAHVDEVNELNVYPVPDGDTGSNMVATVRAALDEAERVGGESASRVAAAISFGALMGARGNSGVITSQIFRGMAEALGGKSRFNGLDLAHALAEGSRTAYGAVAKPVEGTILTVIREASAAAVAKAERANDVETVLAATVDAAEKAVARTPSLLAVLREAGVVDAGGQGLYRLFQGGLLHLLGAAPEGLAAERRVAAKASALIAHADEGFGYETMFLVQAAGGGRLDVDSIRSHLERIGESVLVAGDARAVKVHVHSERPDEVIAYGLSLGGLSRISVENLDAQVRDVREQRAAAFTEAPVATEAPAAIDADATSDTTTAVEGQHPRGPAVVAVVPGEGMAAVYAEFGVDQILRGGQSDNPSTGELLRIARLARQREVLLLPNNPNVRLAAEQAARMCKDKRIVVIPTRNPAEGLAAMLALDPTKDAAANAEPMTVAAREIQTIQVTEAVRDATIGERKVNKGQTIVLDPDDGLVAASTDPERAVLDAIARLRPGFELLTVYYGAEATLADAQEIARRIGDATDGVEVEVVHGGQPHYRYLIAAE
jgi:DAK2 domain fusion protein YloV